MKITLQSDAKKICISVSNETRIDEIIAKSEFKLTRPCGGNGTCGKCKVKAVGNLSEMSGDEKRFLTKEEIGANIRLACYASVTGDANITLITSNEQIQGVTDGYFPDFKKSPLTGDKNCYAMAIDIGTTTIAGYFYKMPECFCVKQTCRTNPQAQFGADVISRIQFANEGGLKTLQKAVQDEIDSMKTEFGEPVELSVITGNTTMLHLFSGLDPSGIAVSPFTPKSLFGIFQENFYWPPCISAYVGADITTAILASNMQKDSSSLLIDIGTNGEMAYWSNGGFTCCSTAAGPAFEGAGISCGMPAISGAIDRVWLENGAIRYRTINHAKPTGICGSGLMDAAACLLKAGIIEDSGYMEDDFTFPDSAVTITAADVRQIQLAKAAIRAGIETLVPNGAGLDCVYIAGGFGSYADIESCITIGLLPPSFQNKVQVLGNAAGTGAAMILQSTECLEKAKEIAGISKTAELSANPQFMEHYMQQMMFPSDFA